MYTDMENHGVRYGSRHLEIWTHNFGYLHESHGLFLSLLGPIITFKHAFLLLLSTECLQYLKIINFDQKFNLYQKHSISETMAPSGSSSQNKRLIPAAQLECSMVSPRIIPACSSVKYFILL